MNQFTHRHINFVGARKVNHMWSPVTLQEFVSRMHDKWMGTHCWLKFRQQHVTTRKLQFYFKKQFYCYVMFEALFARCPFPLCEVWVFLLSYSREAYFFFPFLPSVYF